MEADLFAAFVSIMYYLMEPAGSFMSWLAGRNHKAQDEWLDGEFGEESRSTFDPGREEDNEIPQVEAPYFLRRWQPWWIFTPSYGIDVDLGGLDVPTSYQILTMLRDEDNCRAIAEVLHGERIDQWSEVWIRYVQHDFSYVQKVISASKMIQPPKE